MSAKWMRIESDFVDHPKVRRLCAELSDQRAGWYVMRLWSFVSRFCPTGHLRDIDGTSIETECEWKGEPGVLIAALETCEFVEPNNIGGWDVHDWEEHQGRIAAKAKKERERKAEYRRRLREGVPQDVPSNVPQDVPRDTSQMSLRGIAGRKTLSRAPEKEPPNPEIEMERVLAAMNPETKRVLGEWDKSMGIQITPTWALKKEVERYLKQYPMDEMILAIKGHASDPYSKANRTSLWTVFGKSDVFSAAVSKAMELGYGR